jgi:hypothetical protein
MAGCSSSSLFSSSDASTTGSTTGRSAQSATDRVSAFLFGAPATGPATNVNTNPEEPDCPGVAIRSGASTLAVTTTSAEAGPMTTKYQASIAQTARECAPLGAVMTMKVGVQGRILLGPEGGPGQMDIPLRYAVVQEGTSPKTIWSKFYRITVNITPGQTTVPFVHVEQDLTFPIPRGGDVDDYVVYVGFDPSGAPEKPARGKKKK